MPRKIKVATTCFNEGQCDCETPLQNLEKSIEMLDAFESSKPDLVCFPEVFLKSGIKAGIDVTDMKDMLYASLSEKARKLNSYIIAGTLEVIDNKKCNSAWLIDRSGNLAGRYFKYYPTSYEMEKGILPGSEVPVFETDFGKLGMLICFDIDCPELWNQLSLKGAELVAWVSAYDGGFPLQAYASSKQYYIISSVRSHHAKVIDKTGGILSCTSKWMGWTIREIDLEKTIFHIDAQYQKLLSIQSNLGSKVLIDSFCEENRFTIESNDSEWPVERIKKEFGLESFNEYHARVRKLQSMYR